jgi:hypothetical protein
MVGGADGLLKFRFAKEKIRSFTFRKAEAVETDQNLSLRLLKLPFN